MRSEEELMAAYVAGDRSAFDELFQRLAPILLRVLARQLPNREEANDLVQQTFLQLHRSRHDFRAGARLRPWLFTIAINLKREHFRRMKRRPEAPLELDGRSDPAAVKGDQNRADAQHTLGWAMQRIPSDQAEVITLHWFEGLPFPEVAEVVGASLSAVKVRAHRGYQALRTLLESDPAD
ncbi:MAG: RNA polymerase sigma factor [Myxococcales bacterium]|nr:RNA polymerase sigma factor [Myxococcales bacterium]